MALAIQTTASQAPAPAPDHEIVIVGSGFSGIGAAIRLQKLGIHDFVVLEKADDLGGTWRDNDYPGLAVDMPSFIYSYPFEMSPDWSRVYPPAREIKAYTDHCADKYGIRAHIRLGKTVVQTVYDEEHNVWRTQLEDGEVVVSRYFVSASGLLVRPKMPAIEGIDSFEGKLVHTARWDHAYDLSDKRVAVIGTGATAIQLIPAIVDRVRRLDVYQRTAIWLMPKMDAEIGPRLKRAFRALPVLQRLARFGLNVFVEVTMGMGFVRYTRFPWIFDWVEKKLVEYVRSQVRDPEIQEELIPHYSFFCKRPSFSNVYFPVFNRASVELVTDPIARITKNSIVTRDGREREIDALICATGYSVFDRECMPGFEVFGRGGKNLGDFWETHRYQAYEGASVPGFPNFFLILGPYSTAGASYFTMIDTQTRHLERCLRHARRRHANYIEIKQAAHDRDFRKIDRRRKTTVLFGGNCGPAHSYYFDKRGDTPGVRPVTGLEHWLRSLFFSLKDYDFERRQPSG
jgi:cation diffusion facilitator CzcD-associated flavoprotein CzcO